jgi:hypothetical protein
MNTYKPEDFGPGKSGPQMEWLNDQLSQKGHPIRLWGDTLRDRVAEFQLKQGWKGSGADGLIGPKTLERLTLGPISNLLPADILNLRVWKETLPLDSNGDGKADEIKPPQLLTYKHPKYFHANSLGDGVVFTAPCDGFHTENSFFPRSELRELYPNGALAAWDSADSTHIMEVTQAITVLPNGKPEVVSAQIHDGDDDVCMVRLEGKRLILESEYASDQLLDENYQLGAKFTIRIVATKDGIDVWYNGVKKAHIDGTFTDCYFKTGCYTQATSLVSSSHPKYGTGYGQVIIYELEVSHL